jgi:hypothetical protein
MKILLGLFLMMLMPEVQAQSAGIPAISIDGGNGDGETYSVTLEILALMTMLTVDPAPGVGYCTNTFKSDHPGTVPFSDTVRNVTRV